MKNRIKKRTVVIFLAAGMVLRACSVSYASPQENGEPEDGSRDAAVWRYTGNHLCITNRLENDRQILSAAGQCLREGRAEGEFYVVGKNYAPEGTVLETFYGDSLEYSSTPESSYEQDGDLFQVVRFAVQWDLDSEPEDSDFQENSQKEPEKRYWRLGDTVTRKLGGKSYTFRCIDQNYQSRHDSEETAALFLCDCVIPADTGSGYTYEKQTDGSYEYIYHTGPIAEFGDTSEYKYSKIRRWLKSEEGQLEDGLWVNIGVNQSCLGQTGKGSYSQFRDDAFQAYPMGNQQMTDRWFILSLEEAVKYRQYLWRFGVMPGEKEENPESQIGPFCKGYWLRTPMGDGSGEDSGCVYMVDLVNGTIRPQAGKAGMNAEMNETISSTGVRPAFALPQQG